MDYPWDWIWEYIKYVFKEMKNYRKCGWKKQPPWSKQQQYSSPKNILPPFCTEDDCEAWCLAQYGNPESKIGDDPVLLQRCNGECLQMFYSVGKKDEET
jgi:hypothetical protein